MLLSSTRKGKRMTRFMPDGVELIGGEWFGDGPVGNPNNDPDVAKRKAAAWRKKNNVVLTPEQAEEEEARYREAKAKQAFEHDTRKKGK